MKEYTPKGSFKGSKKGFYKGIKEYTLNYNRIPNVI